MNVKENSNDVQAFRLHISWQERDWRSIDNMVLTIFEVKLALSMGIFIEYTVQNHMAQNELDGFLLQLSFTDQHGWKMNGAAEPSYLLKVIGPTQ